MNDLSKTLPLVASGATRPRAWHLGAARTLIALLFIVSGLHKALGFGDVAAWMASEGVPWPSLALAATIAVEVVGGGALLLGAGQRAAAWLLAAFVVVATVVFHGFWAVPAEQFADQLTHFLKNAAIVGGLLLVIGERRAATTGGAEG